MNLLIKIIFLSTIVLSSVHSDVSFTANQQRNGFSVQAKRLDLQTQLNNEIVPIGNLPLEVNVQNDLRTIQLPSQYIEKPFVPSQSIEVVPFQSSHWQNNFDQPYREPQPIKQNSWVDFFSTFKPFKPQESQQVRPSSSGIWNNLFGSKPVANVVPSQGYNYAKPDKPFEEEAPNEPTTPSSVPEFNTEPNNVEIEELVNQPTVSSVWRPKIVHGVLFLSEQSNQFGNSKDRYVVYKVPSGYNFDRIPRLNL